MKASSLGLTWVYTPPVLMRVSSAPSELSRSEKAKLHFRGLEAGAPGGRAQLIIETGSLSHTRWYYLMVYNQGLCSQTTLGRQVREAQSLRSLNCKMGIKARLLWILNGMIWLSNWVQSKSVMSKRCLLCLIPVTAQMQKDGRGWRWLSGKLDVRLWIPQVPLSVLNKQRRKPQKSFSNKKIIPGMTSTVNRLWCLCLWIY